MLLWPTSTPPPHPRTVITTALPAPLAPGYIPMVGAGSFNQHLDPCFTNPALPPPIFSPAHFHTAPSADRDQVQLSPLLSSASYLCSVYLYTMN